MAGSAEVMAGLRCREGVSYPVLVPNLREFEDAQAAGADTVCLLAGASEIFRERNVSASVGESLDRAAEVAERLHGMGCHEVSLGDTIGTGTPGTGRCMVEAVAERIPVRLLAAHFHDVEAGAWVDEGEPLVEFAADGAQGRRRGPEAGPRQPS